MREEEESANVERNEARRAATTAEAALAETRQSLAILQQQHAETSATRDETEREMQRVTEQRDAARRAAEANQARLQVLEKVRSGYEGYRRGVRTLPRRARRFG